MKLLYHLESTIFYDIEKRRYFYRTAPGPFMCSLSKYFDKVTICAPVKKGKSCQNLEYGGVLKGEKFKFKPLPHWNGILKFFFVFPFNIIRFLRIANKTAKDHDLVWLKLPSISSILFFSFFKFHKKRVILQIGGNIKTAWKKYNFPINIPMYFGSYLLHLATKFMSKKSFNLIHGEELKKLYGKNKVKWIPFYDSNIDRDNIFLKKDRCTNESIKLLFVGNIIKSKGISDLITATKLLTNKEYKVFLDVVGTGSDVPKLKKLIKKLDLDERVKFKGYIPLENGLFEIYRNSDIFILPTYYPEGFPRVILEAWASSLPVVTCNTGGISTLVKNGINGLIVPPGSPQKIAQAIEEIIKNDTLRKKLIKNGHKTAKNYTMEIMSKRVINFLKENQ